MPEQTKAPPLDSVDQLDTKPSPGVKMMFPVRRKANVSHVEFIAYWFAHHMPVTIAAMAGRGRGYIGTVFNNSQDGTGVWDGVAQMFFAEPLQNPPEGFGMKPVDSFHERVEPYFGWATREYVIESAPKHLPIRPLTLSVPFPTSRSGFFKVTSFLPAKTGADHESLYAYWLKEHASRVAEALRQVNGFRYVVGLSLEPTAAPYAGMEELYFHDELAWQQFQELVQADEMDRWVAHESLQRFFSDTEFVAIPL